jgi:hypothetical protein
MRAWPERLSMGKLSDAVNVVGDVRQVSGALAYTCKQILEMAERESVFFFTNNRGLTGP